MSENICAICTEEHVRPAGIACSHRFCRDCILAWSRTTNLCPLCKVEFRFIIATNPPESIPVRKKRQRAEYDSEEIARLDFSSDEDEVEEDSDATDEYEIDGFVVPDETSIDGYFYSCSSSSSSNEQESESEIEIIQLNPPKRLRRRAENEEDD